MLISGLTKIQNVKEGEVFSFGGDLWLKVPIINLHDGDMINVVSLQTGYLDMITNDKMVLLHPDAKVML